jgi:hypothetical protein
VLQAAVDAAFKSISAYCEPKSKLLDAALIILAGISCIIGTNCAKRKFSAPIPEQLVHYRMQRKEF